MAARNQQTHAKRARELAVKERRERKRARKLEVAEQRAAGLDPYASRYEVDSSDEADEVTEGESAAESAPAETL
jgi:hypothetical protein